MPVLPRRGMTLQQAARGLAGGGILIVPDESHVAEHGVLYDQNGRVLPHPIRRIVEHDLAMLNPTMSVERLGLDAKHPVGMNALGTEEVHQRQGIEQDRRTAACRKAAAAA